MSADDIDLIAADTKVPKFTLEGLNVRAKCVCVYDGDTAQFVFSPYPEKKIYRRFSCRLLGYNTAEMKGKTVEERTKALSQRDALRGLILNKIVNLKVGKYDKYGRLLVQVEADGTDVNKWMIDKVGAMEYFGSGMKSW